MNEVRPVKPIMTVKEARKLLGKEAEIMTDEQVAILVEQTHELAVLALDVAKDKLTKEKTTILNSSSGVTEI